MTRPDKILYDGVNKDLKIYDDRGSLLYLCECHNDSVADNAWRSDAGCPPGTYTLTPALRNDPNAGNSLMNDWIGEGIYFIPVNGIDGHSGIGIHGGGSCSPSPLAPEQGWCPTMNCFRLQNENLEHIVDAYDLNGVTFEVTQPDEQ